MALEQSISDSQHMPLNLLPLGKGARAGCQVLVEVWSPIFQPYGFILSRLQSDVFFWEAIEAPSTKSTTDEGDTAALCGTLLHSVSLVMNRTPHPPPVHTPMRPIQVGETC